VVQSATEMLNRVCGADNFGCISPQINTWKFFWTALAFCLGFDSERGKSLFPISNVFAGNNKLGLGRSFTHVLRAGKGPKITVPHLYQGIKIIF
jgi:hypothetical protein